MCIRDSAYPWRKARDALIELRAALPAATELWAGGAGLAGRGRGVDGVRIIGQRNFLADGAAVQFDLDPVTAPTLGVAAGRDAVWFTDCSISEIARATQAARRSRGRKRCRIVGQAKSSSTAWRATACVVVMISRNSPRCAPCARCRSSLRAAPVRSHISRPSFASRASMRRSRRVSFTPEPSGSASSRRHLPAPVWR